jgi:hypothetical protein
MREKCVTLQSANRLEWLDSLQVTYLLFKQVTLTNILYLLFVVLLLIMRIESM